MTCKDLFTIRSEKKKKKVSLNVVFATLIYSTWVVLIYNSFQAFSATSEKRGKKKKHAITQEVAITRFTNNQNLLIFPSAQHAPSGWTKSTVIVQRPKGIFKFCNISVGSKFWANICTVCKNWRKIEHKIHKSKTCKVSVLQVDNSTVLLNAATARGCSFTRFVYSEIKLQFSGRFGFFAWDAFFSFEFLFRSVFLSFSTIFLSCPPGLKRFVFWQHSFFVRPFLAWQLITFSSKL